MDHGTFFWATLFSVVALNLTRCIGLLVTISFFALGRTLFTKSELHGVTRRHPEVRVPVDGRGVRVFWPTL